MTWLCNQSADEGHGCVALRLLQHDAKFEANQPYSTSGILVRGAPTEAAPTDQTIMSEFPIVSAIIPTWNGERYLREAIDSALDQNYSPLEVIVVDDGSTDSTEEICRSYGNLIRYFRQPKDTKYGATAYVRALREAKGKYAAILDHDDRWLPGKIARQVEAMEAQPEAGIVFTRFRIIDENGADQGVSQLTAPSGKIFHLLLESNRFCHASAMYRKDIAEAVGGINVDIGCGDWDMWLRIARHYPIIMIEDVLTEYRVHSGGYSRQPQRMVEALKRVIANQRDQWHSLDCDQCRRASLRGNKMANHLYVSYFHDVARSGRPGTLMPALFDALRNAPDAMLSPKNLIATAKSLFLYIRHGISR